MDKTSKTQIKVIIVGVGLRKQSVLELKESLNELEDISWASEREVVGSILQQLTQFNPSTLVGKGKVLEIKEYIQQTGAEEIIIDRELSGTQQKNLSLDLEVKVLDRTELILEIFAKRAKTYEGKLQVQMAQLLNQLPRLVGGWNNSLSRQGGGSYSRGPGEKALEKDKRQVEDRLKVIRKKLKEIKKNRSQQRTQRKKSNLPSFALLGYTNSGKSTLLQALSGSKTLIKDQVFATLDPMTRRVSLGPEYNVLVTDTVGFIRQLPESLIEAFEATLEEASDVDIILFVIDISKRDVRTQVDVVESIISRMGWDEKPILYIYNKQDLANLDQKFQAQKYPRAFISATTKNGFDLLFEKMKSMLNELSEEVTLYFSKEQEHKLFELTRVSTDLKKESHAQGTVCKVRLPAHQIREWKMYLVKKTKIE